MIGTNGVGPLTIDEGFAAFAADLVAANRDGQTLEHYRMSLRRFRRFLDARGLPDDLRPITRIELRDFATYLRHEYVSANGAAKVPGKLSDYTVAGTAKDVKALFSWLAKDELLPDDPTPRVKVAQPRPEPLEAFTEGEVSRLLSYKPRDRSGLRTRAFVAFVAETGCRTVEARRLRLEDLDLAGQRARVVGKRSKPRLVPLSDGLVAILNEYLERGRRQFIRRRFRTPFGEVVPATEEEPWVFRSGHGTQITDSAAIRLFDRFCRAAGVDRRGRGLHALRRAFSVRWIMRGGDPYTLRLLLGHSNLNIIASHYASLLPADVDERFRTLGVSVLVPATPAASAGNGQGRPSPAPVGGTDAPVGEAQPARTSRARRERRRVRIRRRRVLQRAGTRSLASGRPPVPLSPREREILVSAARGLTSAEIGRELGIAEPTVRHHFSSILLKLGARRRTDAVLEAVRRGWIGVS